jgi:hypothetical protein
LDWRLVTLAFGPQNVLPAVRRASGRRHVGGRTGEVLLRFAEKQVSRVDQIFATWVFFYNLCNKNLQ